MNRLQIYLTCMIIVCLVCYLGYLFNPSQIQSIIHFKPMDAFTKMLLNKSIGNVDIPIIQNQVSIDSKIKLTWFRRPHWYPKDFDFSNCSFKNCIYSDDKQQIPESHALLFYYRNLGKIVPSFKPKNQMWIIFEFESPLNDGPLSSKWNTQFDLFHTYATGSDVLRRNTPEIRQKLLQKNYSDIFKRKTRMVAWVVSNCNSHSKRSQYHKELAKYIEIDVFGKCGRNKSSTICKGMPNTKCHIKVSQIYKFYLGFENSLCEDYVTEKLTNSYANDHDAIVVYRGAPNIDSIFPNDSYINAERFHSVKELAQYLIKVGNNETAYTDLLKSKHKYFVNQPNPLCNICKTMNTLSERNKTLHGRDFNAWYRITVSNTTDQTFRGFLIQAKNQDMDIIPGFVQPEEKGKLVPCTAANGALTHSEATDKQSVSFEFRAPNSSVGDITMYATVVKEKLVFWQEITSAVIRDNVPVTGGSTGNIVVSNIAVLFILTISLILFQL